ncbi:MULTISPECIES: sugar ABC transporter ATP-binding protein [Rhizobium/Agrobacterium group]|uniref:ABC transporter nucleotide binding/ATPase protein (Ribose) n=2 Tax=Rhizobium/Agrobacterium group TaxID=227290 RepID=B9K043_ALLAM|nr:MULTISPECIES: sugar ABC transporter ATP-binding protein [Rhizobium/Agrobacterium group]ACM38241.1 ABC transporter nucleotide binding/ATPase protein (ribose) [Allorhizobium ampelinum S4]MCF1445400.1 sugar ABC transporter ATP-binding protein [Allorhizobium ampelinum]MCF1472433.1 sugar ABC transporter ATP-binding protein [Allorhizobium ampelinum]MCF1495402.1 sugar ABC transporter ATP-binding protein [Allorhizobium ampelinum]MUO27067.1 ATP-binding cassette domain-containing protein [Agrobacteri
MTISQQAVLAATAITKTFGAHVALHTIDIAFRPGEVHALLGENGAGKSTLIKILTGAYTPDAGTVLVDGAPMSFSTPQQAQAAGIGTVYQEVNLLTNMTVADNLFIGRQPRRFGLVDHRTMEREARRILSGYGLDIDVRAELATFSVAVQQIIAIARAVELSGKVLILDEPTASLDRSEVLKLFEIVRGLKARGLAIVFITHFLDQVFELCDHATVLRNGKLVGSQPIDTLNRTTLVRMMLGKDLSLHHDAVAGIEAEVGESLMQFTGYGLDGKVQPFTLTIHKGEVIGVAGLLGSGRTEMARLMFGIDSADKGELTLNGASFKIRSPRQAIDLGFGFCPEDRKADGIFGDLSVRENIIIAMQAKLGWLRTLSYDEQMEIAGQFIEALDIRTASAELPIKLLSGGNQQKAILARWLATDPRFLILDEPTRGIDVGAHAEIVRMISRLREDGLALIVISSELDEVVSYSSRIVVMRDRAMVAELHGADIAPDVIVQTIAAQSNTPAQSEGAFS